VCGGGTEKAKNEGTKKALTPGFKPKIIFIKRRQPLSKASPKIVRNLKVIAILGL
jgi:hypothetical protein